jgi:hypothetical protein
MVQAKKGGMWREIDNGERRGCALYNEEGKVLALIVTVSVVRI